MVTWSDDQPLRVASWPGLNERHNAFIRIFLTSLQTVGCTVESCETVEDVEYAVSQAPDILLLHWAERVFRESKTRWHALSKMRRLVKATRTNKPTKVIWLVHNVVPHDARRFQKMVWGGYIRALARGVDGIMTLSPGTVQVVRTAIPLLAAKPAKALWHPRYADAEISPEARKRVRENFGFGPEHSVFGYCGQIRPYKGIEELTTAFLRTPGNDLRLLLAGRPSRCALSDWLREKSAADPRIVLRLNDLSDGDFTHALGVCDTFVAPFRSYLHSGSIVHALSAARPVLTPDTPFARDYRNLVGADWVQLYRGTLTSEHLSRAVLPASQRPDLSSLSEEGTGQQAAEFFRSLLHVPRGH